MGVLTVQSDVPHRRSHHAAPELSGSSSLGLPGSSPDREAVSRCGCQLWFCEPTVPPTPPPPSRRITRLRGKARGICVRCGVQDRTGRASRGRPLHAPERHRRAPPCPGRRRALRCRDGRRRPPHALRPRVPEGHGGVEAHRQKVPQRPARTRQVTSPDNEPSGVPRAAIEAAHADQIRTHGGQLELRDDGLLDSAVARPQNRWRY